jgi:F0F1-type ATP synthase epsilon subunit
METRISSLQGIVFEGLIKKIIIPTKMGEITVLPHHRSLITSLTRGVITIFDDQDDEKFYWAQLD